MTSTHHVARSAVIQNRRSCAFVGTSPASRSPYFATSVSAARCSSALSRSVRQLVYGVYMLWESKRLRLAQRYFREDYSPLDKDEPSKKSSVVKTGDRVLLIDDPRGHFGVRDARD